MKKYALVVLMLFASLVWAGTKSNPADYPLSAHVSSAQFREGSVKLLATIDGKKYELQGPGWLLIPGDYNARLVKNDQKPSYEPHLSFEFLFPDNKTRLYSVIGIME